MEITSSHTPRFNPWVQLSEVTLPFYTQLRWPKPQRWQSSLGFPHPPISETPQGMLVC